MPALIAASAGNPFVTAALMSVKRFLPEGADNGALVAAPQYSAVMLHRVVGHVQDSAVALHRLANSMFAAATDPCTDQIFWWHGGEFHPVHIVAGESAGAVQVRVPEALTPVVERLNSGH
ncbi:hypothetical protein ACNAW0_28235 [Micromonospora sp. SL1-18]|uniref:hypothetical protein n=1 Tax=Micromonospora sp. SL1-18 TaxID=3399128 RepID=UPI003A4E646D